MKHSGIGFILRTIVSTVIVCGIFLGTSTFIEAGTLVPAAAGNDNGWTVNPANLHSYKVIVGCSGWHACEDAAVSEGAHLVTVNDSNEQAWLVSTFGEYAHFWIGYTDEGDEGNWTWISGESATYTNWASGEPSNSGGLEHYAYMNWTPEGLWNDAVEDDSTVAIIERAFKVYAPYVVKTNVFIPPGWEYNETTFHYYKVITCTNGWHACEDMAVIEGAHLVTVNEATEHAWLVSTFGGDNYFWIGYTDEGDEGNWYWISGEFALFVNWAPGEPSNSDGNEHYAMMNWPTAGLWNDGELEAISRGIIERNSFP